MGVNRIVRRALARAGEAKKMYHRKKRVNFFKFGDRHFTQQTAWVDIRPRDKQGTLAGYCAWRVADLAHRRVARRDSRFGLLDRGRIEVAE